MSAVKVISASISPIIQVMQQDLKIWNVVTKHVLLIRFNEKADFNLIQVRLQQQESWLKGITSGFLPTHTAIIHPQ